MKPRSPFFRRLVALGILAAVVCGLSVLWNEMRPNCTTIVLDRVPSPDGVWVAVNEKFVCEVVESDIEGEVHLVTTRPPFREIPLLLIGYGSYVNRQRPHIAWSVRIAGHRAVVFPAARGEETD